MSDIFGHIPRKKKDAGGENSQAVPRKSSLVINNVGSVSTAAASTHSQPSTDLMSIPRKKKNPPPPPPATDSFQKQPRQLSSSGSYSSAGINQVSSQPQQLHKLDRNHYYPKRQNSFNTGGHRQQEENLSSSTISATRRISTSSLPAPEQHRQSHALPDPGIVPVEDDIRLVSNERFRVISENPLVLKIKIHDIPMLPLNPVLSTPPAVKASRIRRQVVAASTTSSVDHGKTKRQRSVYQELEDTDSDDFMTPEEEQELINRRQRKRLKKQSKAGNGSSVKVEETTYTNNSTPTTIRTDEVASSATMMDMATATGEPAEAMVPPGVISSLWYSGEFFLDTFVLDKVCGWKTRQKLILMYKEEENNNEEGSPMSRDTPSPITNNVVTLDREEADALQQKMLTNQDFMYDVKTRMEISRINPTHCPVVMTLAAAVSNSSNSSSSKVKEEHEDAIETKNTTKKKYKIEVESEREEVLLIKWRGRSYFHCSWERASDVQRLDQSTNFTARSKIRRYYQTQELKLGHNWKTVIEDERKAAAALHGHGVGGSTDQNTSEVGDVGTEPVDEYFSTQCLEVERVMACDENTMNMDVLSKQRAINMRKEQEMMKRKDEITEDVCKDQPVVEVSTTTIINPWYCMIQPIIGAAEHQWDPEDNVRYVIKWKGLPYSEMTWEYWRDIKRDAVDEVEDFWYRQQAPSIEEATRLANKTHPHIRTFKKLTESRFYGISERPRPVFKFEGDKIEGEITSSNNDDEGDSDPGFQLRGYQLEGVNWLLFNWWNKRSCILADEMGLGKTIQSAAFLQELQSQSETEVRGPFLIVAPLSLVGQWQSELASWAPDMNVILYHGSADAREYLTKEEFYYTEQFIPKASVSKLKRLHITKFHVLITTFEVVLKDIAVLSKIKWRALLVDEAHRLKNSNSKLFEELASVPRDYCVLLTGTPIANATEELWALLHFANPDVFKEKDDFLEKFGEMTDAKQVNELHTLLKPYLLRRVKEDVEKSLPPKEETILEVSLTPIQKTFYKAIYERNTSFLFKGAKPNNAPSLMNVMMELRKCCNHPFLVKGAEERILNEAASKIKSRAEEEGTSPVAIDYYKLFGEQLVKSSGKMVLMEKLLDKLFADGHKVLIFSQMVRVLDLLEELLKLKKFRYERLDGSTSSSSRVHAVERFKRKSLQRFVMLLSTRAGGLGLNLTAASIVIIFDSDWNPQNDLQAMARAHRIGQTKAVRVYRFLTAKTYEMHMFHSASMKLGLERAVLSQSREQNDDNEDNSKSKRKSEKEAQAKEIDELLKKGAYDVFRDDDDKEGEKFMETDIDQFLEQSSKKITYGTGATTSLGSGLGSFSKASFVAKTEDGAKDVDLDDPDFWSKAIGLEVPQETPEDVAAMLDDGVKRSRKQVQVYDPYAETAEAERLKKEKIALEKQLEKEEKERALLAKKKKKLEKKKKKRFSEDREKGVRTDKDSAKVDDEKKDKSHKKPKVESGGTESTDDSKKMLDIKSKKQTKKIDRMRAIKRAENEEPLIERIKQAWEAPHRNRATAAALRFGFGRFCKIRHESNLSGLPLQDFESFVSSYIYQLSLQFSVSLLERLRDDENLSNIKDLIQEWLGTRCENELEWICDSVQSAMKLHLEVESYRRFLRMPMILAEPSYVAELRRGAAFRALRRIGILSRLNCIIEEELDIILSGLGHEELGKRGCGINELSSLDSDLKARYVTTEELYLGVSSNFQRLDMKPPASWWDRSCDVALIVGSFIHGVSNYEAMRNDLTLPFAEKIRKASEQNIAAKFAMQTFKGCAGAARRVFDDALEAARVKAELEVQAAVAAAAKAALKREEDAALMRKGGAEAEVAAKNMPETQVENAFEFDGTDSHFVTLSRMHEYLQESLHKDPTFTGVNLTVDISQESVKIEEDLESQDDGGTSSGRMKIYHLLPMPDARVLDHRLGKVLEIIESVLYGYEPNFDVTLPFQWEKSSDVNVNMEMRNKTYSTFVKESADVIGEYSGVGLGGSQCGASHRSLNDGSDYSFGSASNQLSQVAYGTDAPRFLRAMGVPMNITRFAVTSLAFVDASCVEELLRRDRLRYYGSEEKDVRPKVTKSERTELDVSTDAIESDNPAVVKSEDIDETMVTLSPVDPIDLIPTVFREDTYLRASVCMACVFYGFPNHYDDSAVIDSSLWDVFAGSEGSDEGSSPALFNGQMFRDVICSLTPNSHIPDLDALQHYVVSILLPHCLRLCINGNGPATRNARGSHGEYETAFGVSVHPEPSQQHPSPLPDPCLSLQDHSIEAVSLASALLRRVRLLRCCQYLCSGNHVAYEQIVALTKSTIMCQLSDMPIWWCPWKHDIALLIQAATGGLFSVVPKRDHHEIFSPQAVQEYLTISVLRNGNNTKFWKQSSQEQIETWTEQEANKFPSLFQLERRLASLCSEATSEVQDDYFRYHNLPMFDHGGWPRN